jgi:putative membrane protein
MLWVKAFHIILMITWFAGLFYLPRLFVYHAMTDDQVGIDRFKIMERKLYYGIMTPGGMLTTATGLWLLIQNIEIYLTFWWMQAKLALLVLLWVFHFSCGYYRKQFVHDANKHSHVFYRWFNEVPTVIMIAVVILIVVKP